MAISPRFMGELRDRVMLSDIIGGRIKLSRAGREFKGCCPFHKEKTPSFYVNDDKQFYHCFGCGAHGDAVGFVMQHDNLTFIEAVESLAAKAGLQVPQQSPAEVAKAKKAKGLHELVEDAAQFFESQLQDSRCKDAVKYLHERGMPDELLSSFRVGFAPADGQALYKYLKTRDYKDEDMIEAGLVRASTRGGAPYSFFRDRIMFPVTDRRGRVVAFGGRAMPEHLRPPSRDGKKPPKYINSSETPLFHKGLMLYGESHARQAAGEGQDVLVVEGYVDVMACFEAGFKGAVAPLGTALTEEQIMALWKMIPHGFKAPTLCFDGDNAGRKAASRACERILPLLKPDHSARFAFLPEGQDPDSLLRAQGGGAFKAVLDAAIPLVDFIWSHHTAGRTFDTPEQRAGLSKTLNDDVMQIADRTVQQYYRQAFKDRLFNEFGRKKQNDWKNNNYKKNYGGKNGRKSNNVMLPQVKIGKPSFQDDNLRKQILLAAVLNHPVLLDTIEEEFGSLFFGNERFDSLKQSVLAFLDENAELERDALHNYLKEQGFKIELGFLLTERVYTHAGFVKPQTELDKALSGWQETWQFIHQKTLGEEIKQAGKALAGDFSEEKQERWLALHDAQKASSE